MGVSKWEQRLYCFILHREEEKEEKERKVAAGGAGRLCIATVCVWTRVDRVSDVQSSGFMDPLTEENVLLFSGPCPD